MHSLHHIAKPHSSQNTSSSKSLFFQPKLTINNPDDQYEKEADVMADKVMRMQQPFVQAKPLPISSVQRKCAHCEEEEEKVQRKEMNGSEAIADHTLESYVGNLDSNGQSLHSDVRDFYEPHFGYDFSNVKVHTDSVAAKSAQSINALAYTSGSNIVFNSEQYSPNTDSGKRLLGHELTHVVQQTDVTGRVSMMKKVSTSGPTIQRTCGSAPIASVAGSHVGCNDNFDGVFVAGSWFKFNPNCDDFATGQESAMIRFVTSLATTATLEIHGYASIDGDPTFNQNLGCARLLKAQSALISSAGAGIAASRITTIMNHGPVPGPAADRRSVVIKTITTPQPTQSSCGPDVTDWFVRIMNSAKTHPAAVAIKNDLDSARTGGAAYGYSYTDVMEGGIARRVLAAEAAAGHPRRTADASAQLGAADPHNQFGRAVTAATAPILFAGAPEQMLLLLIRRAGNRWVSMVQTGAVWDFKNNILSAVSLAGVNCTNPCPNPPTVTLCGNCYEHDLPGNLFYAYIGRYCGFSLNALQLGSQYAELLPTSSSNWDTPEDTAAIRLGFSLPSTISRSNLCSALTAAGNSVTVRPCINCATIYPT